MDEVEEDDRWRDEDGMPAPRRLYMGGPTAQDDDALVRIKKPPVRDGLQVGERFTLTPDCTDGGREFEVLIVTAAGAYVRPVTRNHKVIETVVHTVEEVDGKAVSVTTDKRVEFDVPARGFIISAHSSVVLLKGEGDDA